MLTTIIACPRANEEVNRSHTPEHIYVRWSDDDDNYSSDSSSSGESDCPDPWIYNPHEDEEEDEDDTETLVPSSTTTAIATPRMHADEKLPESSAHVKISSTGSFEKIQEADLETQRKHLIESLEQVIRAQQEYRRAVPATPVPTPTDATPEITSKGPDFVEKLTQKLEALPVTEARAYAEPDRHLYAFDLIPFPTVDFDTPLVSHPDIKPKAVGKTHGAGRSGFCNSFKSVALRDAAVF